jgi:hypothetical protein
VYCRISLSCHIQAWQKESCWDVRANATQAVLDAAGSAMYLAKRNGCNRVEPTPAFSSQSIRQSAPQTNRYCSSRLKQSKERRSFHLANTPGTRRHTKS